MNQVIGGSAPVSTESRISDESLLEVENVSLSFGGVKAIRNVSFDIKSGEIVGLAGLVGSGRSELAQAIFGVTLAESGGIHLAGQKVDEKLAARAAEAAFKKATPLANNAYKITVGKTILKRTILAAAGQLNVGG